MLPVIAGLALTSLAIAQETPRIEDAPKPEIRIKMMKQIHNGGFLGVQIEDVTADNSSTLSTSDMHGAVVSETVKESPAEKAGLQKNDVIVSWNGTPVKSAMELRRLVAETPAGSSARVGYIRSGVQNDVEVTLDKRKDMMAFQFKCDSTMVFKKFLNEDFMKGIPQCDEKQMREWQEKFQQEMKSWSKQFDPEKMKELRKQLDLFVSMGDTRTGAMLQSITPQLAKYFGVNEGSGALIGSVNEKSPAETAGLQAGDVVIEIAGEKVTSPRDVHRIISSKGEEEVDVKVIREKQERTFRLKLSAASLNDNLPHHFFQEFGNHPRIIIPFDGEFKGEFHPFNGEEEFEIEINPAPSEKSNGENSDMELGDVIIPRERLQRTAPFVTTPLPSHELAPPSQPVDL
jgi:C-terminal processing protease CtpA/Prc